MTRYLLSTGNTFSGHSSVEIQKSGPLKDFINRAPCLAHEDNPAKWPKQMAYIFSC